MRWSLLYLGGICLLAKQAQGACTLCPGETLSPTPDLRIPYSSVSGESSSEDLTCVELEAVAREIEQDDECYAFTELTGYATLCRCHINEQTCTFCSDGSVPESVATQGGLCAEEFLYLPYMTAGTDACARTQHLGHLQCECPEPPVIPEDACTLCADGSAPTADLSTEVDESTTCADLVAIATGTDEDSAKCFKLQTMGKDVCGCSAPLEHCSLCADGSEPLHPDRRVDENTTCADLSDLVSPFSPICPHIQASGHFLCGCSTPPTIFDPQGPCTLCAGGEDFKETYNLDEELDVVTCSDTAAAVYTAMRSSQTCRFHQAYAFLYCGCESMPPSASTPSCTMCSNGMEPLFPDKIVPGTADMTCRTANNLVSHLFDSDICEDLDELQEACGCPEQKPCSLCRDHESITDSQVLIQTSSGYFTCQELDQAARNLEVSSDLDDFFLTCQSFRDDYGSGCCHDNIFSKPDEDKDTEVLTGEGNEPTSGARKIPKCGIYWAASMTVLAGSYL